MLLLVLGMVAMPAGIIILVLRSMWGLVLLLGGLGAMIFCYSTMMRARGINPDQGTITGLNGQGKQQSEAVKVCPPVMGEQPADIWERVEKK